MKTVKLLPRVINTDSQRGSFGLIASEGHYGASVKQIWAAESCRCHRMRTIHKNDENTAGAWRLSQKREEEDVSNFSIKHLLSFLSSAPRRLSLIEDNQEVKLLIFKEHLLVPIQYVYMMWQFLD